MALCGKIFLFGTRGSGRTTERKRTGRFDCYFIRAVSDEIIDL